MTGAACRSVPAALLVAVTVAVTACGNDAGTGPSATARLEFSPATLELGQTPEELAAAATLRNAGEASVGPVELAGGVVTVDGSALPGAAVSVTPPEVPTLAPGASAQLSVVVLLPDAPPSGSYQASLQARLGGEVAATLGVSFSLSAPGGPPVASLRITGAPATLRQGDVLPLGAEAFDDAGQPVEGAVLTWSVSPAGAGLITSDGRLVGYVPGPVRARVISGTAADSVALEVTPRGLATGGFEVAGHGALTDRFTSDLWVHGDAAYTGTWGQRGETGLLGNRLYAWDISDPSSPLLTDSVALDARTVNDVKVRSDGTLAVATHEVSADGRNGITLLDLADPHHPVPITRFSPSDFFPGIHNVWVEGTHVYAVVDGVSSASGLRVVDISDPSSPAVLNSFYAGSSFLHDVYVRDGLAFLSHWDAGLVILDVGAGLAGGSPEGPREVGRVQTFGGQTHNAWYWPAAGYVFVGEEDFNTPGMMHVVDVRDPRSPREVATFRVPGDTPHNFWLDEERGILYLAWYRLGLHALDVSGELLGELERQGRVYGAVQYGSGSFCFGGAGTCTWAPQLEGGLVWVSDLNTGLWALRPTF